MKILLLACTICFLNVGFSQSKAIEEQKIADSLKTKIQGTWYLSGIYSTDLNSRKDYSSSLTSDFSLRFEKDSVYFIEPPTRFLIQNNTYYYTISYKDSYLGTNIYLYNSKKHKKPFKQMHFQFVGNELMLEEVLTSDLYENLSVHRSYVLNQSFDPMQLEQKLQKEWKSFDLITPNLNECEDTLSFFTFDEGRLNYRKSSDWYNISFQRNPGWSMMAYSTIAVKSETNTEYSQQKYTVLLHPENQEIELIDRNGSYHFQVLVLEDNKLVLVKKK